MISVKDAAAHFGLTGPRLKQILKEHDLDFYKEPNGYIKIPNASMAALNSLRKISYKKTIGTIGIEKGGSGKTIITLNTALTASRYGRKVLVCDFDPECCASLFLAKEDLDWDSVGSIYEVFQNEKQIADYIINSRFDGVDFLPGKILVRRLDRILDSHNPKHLLKKKMLGLLDFYDLILFDLPPSFNKLCASAYLSSDIVICPVNSDVFSIESLHLTIEDINEACDEFEVQRPQIHVLKNRFSADNMKRKASKETAAELNKEFAEILLPYQVRASACIENCLNGGITLYDAPKENGLEEIKTAFFDLFSLLCVIDEGRGSERLGAIQ